MTMLAERINVGVVPGGALGKAFAGMAAEKGYNVTVWFHEPESLQAYEPPSKNVLGTCNMWEAVAGADVIFLAPPARFFRPVFQKAQSYSDDKAMFLSGSKGLEYGTSYTMTQIMRDEKPRLIDRIAAMSGPNLASEIVGHEMLGTVIASYQLDAAKALQALFQSNYFRIYVEPDVVGVEAGGALKNIFAFGAGIGNALGVRPGTMALYMTRSLAEMTRLGMALGAKDICTFLNLSGVGDLSLSCDPGVTRNEKAGEAFVQGKTREELLASGDLAEGLYTIEVAHALAKKHEVEAPITEGIYGVLHGHFSIREGIERLMGRPLTEEQLGGQDILFRLARFGERALGNAGVNFLPNHGKLTS